MARASGLQLVGGKEANDPINASTIGTGQLIDTALNEGAERIIVCVGGSATTDGGLGALQAISTPARLRAVDFVVACDVRTKFVDAARQFAPQKGASTAQIEFLTNRLQRLTIDYKEKYGVDVSVIELARGKDILLGVVDVGSEAVETPETVAARLKAALPYCDPGHLFACTDCGMMPLPRASAAGKLRSLAQGAALANAG